jgi:hypothetical protein
MRNQTMRSQEEQVQQHRKKLGYDPQYPGRGSSVAQEFGPDKAEEAAVINRRAERLTDGTFVTHEVIGRLAMVQSSIEGADSRVSDVVARLFGEYYPKQADFSDAAEGSVARIFEIIDRIDTRINELHASIERIEVL